ncbi:MAG: NAD(P)-dependent oxidoreductase [Candidatus Kaiserbacteria bacterium]|nr:NAD(P)-dependent oxidoreductase [Candidatus Kaiserbacteria bacterium]
MNHTKILITGGVGFLGSHLVKYLLEKTDSDIVIFDQLEESSKENSDRVTYYKGNIFSPEDVNDVFQTYGPFVVVYHLAASMPDKSVSDDFLWKTNVTGTEIVAACALRNKARSFIFTSSNVLYGIPKKLPTTEETPAGPLEIYGKSKVEAEKILRTFKGKMDIQIFRCPVVTGLGRLGLQAILFEFISEDRNAYVLGDGSNQYQFADAVDVCAALEKASHSEGFDIYNIGSDEILSLKEIYQKVIDFAGSESKIISIPKKPALFMLSVLNRLNISPLGVYQYTMYGRSLYADTTKIKSKLNWKPEKTNAGSFIENYTWYKANKGKFVDVDSNSASSNRSLPRTGIFKLLKILS